MKWFWPTYLATAAIGTLGVYFLAPLARPYVSHTREDQAPEAPRATQPERTAVKPVAAVPAPAPAAARAPAAAPEDEDTPPALLGVYLAATGDRPGWGVTSQRTTYYKLDGTRQGAVPGGVLFDVARAHQSSKGAMIECSFLQGGATNGPFLVSRRDVMLYTLSHTKLSQRQVHALLAYYELSGKVGVRKSELLQASASKNPHFAAANAAYQAYLASVNKAKELAAQRATATELDKVRLEDQLRELKVAEVKLKADLDAANAKFRDWKQQHASEIAKPENDPDVKRWTAEMETLRKKVQGLAM